MITTPLFMELEGLRLCWKAQTERELGLGPFF